jgi:hypothetical protein
MASKVVVKASGHRARIRLPARISKESFIAADYDLVAAFAFPFAEAA